MLVRVVVRPAELAVFLGTGLDVQVMSLPPNHLLRARMGDDVDVLFDAKWNGSTLEIGERQHDRALATESGGA